MAGSPSPGTIILFLESFEVDESLEIINFNIILRFLNEFKSIVKILFLSIKLLSILTEYYQDLKYNDFFRDKFIYMLKI